MRAKTILLVFSVSITAGMLVFAEDLPEKKEDPTVSSWMEHGRGCLDGVFSIKADFVHEVIHRLGSVQQTMSGKVWLRRGSRLRMEYESPTKKLVVSDGKIVRAWDQATKTLIESPADRSILTEVFRFVLGDQVSGGFATRFIGGAKVPGKGIGVIELLPLKATPLFERILLSMSGECPSVERVTLVDREGTAIRITLKNMKTNVGISKKQFQFDPPKGAKIVRP